MIGIQVVAVLDSRQAPNSQRGTHLICLWVVKNLTQAERSHERPAPDDFPM